MSTNQEPIRSNPPRPSPPTVPSVRTQETMELCIVSHYHWEVGRRSSRSCWRRRVDAWAIPAPRRTRTMIRLVYSRFVASPPPQPETRFPAN